MKIATTIAAVSLALSPAVAQAGVVFDNGLPDGLDGNETVQWVQAEDFSFSANTTVTGAGVYLGGLGGIGNWDGSFQYGLFSDAGGSPGAALVGMTGASVTTINSGLPWLISDTAYLFAFNFATPFNAVGGTNYWLGIHAGVPGNTNRDDIYWTTTANNMTQPGHESDLGTFNNWADNRMEHAFFLIDGGNNGAVPEPATWALMLLGMAGTGFAMRRQRQTQKVRFAF